MVEQLSTYNGADGFLAIFGFIIVVGLLIVMWFTFVVLKLLMSSLFQNIFATDSSALVSSKKYKKYKKARNNPNDFWDEPDMGTYVTMPNGNVRID